MEELVLTVLRRSVGGTQRYVVNTRELYEQLQVKTEYRHWIKRRLKAAMLEKNVHYVEVIRRGDNGRPTKEHLVTIDSAKHLAMMERTIIGKRVRQYFIDFEDQVRKAQALNNENLAEAAKAVVHYKTVTDVLDIPLYKALPQIVKEVELNYGVNFTKFLNMSPIMDKIPVDEPEFLEVTAIGKRINESGITINKFLHEIGWQLRNVYDPTVWEPMVSSIKEGLCWWHGFQGANSEFTGKNLKWNVNKVLKAWHENPEKAELCRPKKRKR